MMKAPSRQTHAHAVVRGRLDTTALASLGQLRFLNGAVQPVLATLDGTLIVGPARVVAPNVPATNGVVHIIGTVLSPSAAVNSSGVAIAERMGDFGPFNASKVGAQSCTCQTVSALLLILPNVASAFQMMPVKAEYLQWSLGALSLPKSTRHALSIAILSAALCCLQREQMFSYEITFLPASLPSLPSSYRRVRMVGGYPDGGVKNPMALAFMPRAALEAGRATAKLPTSASSLGSWLQPYAQPPVMRPASDVDLCFMTVRCCYVLQ